MLDDYFLIKPDPELLEYFDLWRSGLTLNFQAVNNLKFALLKRGYQILIQKLMR